MFSKASYLTAQQEAEAEERVRTQTRKYLKSLNWKPGDREGPPLVPLPLWEPAHPDIPDCKCLKINISDLCERLANAPEVMGYDIRGLFDPAGTGVEVYTAMQCHYEWKRKGGCKNGAACCFCHVHPTRKDEPDGSQRVPVDPANPKGRGRKMHRDERQAHRAAKGRENETRQDLWREIKMLALEDAQENVHFGRPIGPVHFVYWTVHKILAETLPMYSRTSQMWGLTEKQIGLWLGVDSQHSGAGHYPRGPGRAIHTLMKGFVLRLRKLAARTTAEYIVMMESDCRWQDGLASPEGFLWLNGFVQDYLFVWLGFFNSEWPSYHGEMKSNSHYFRDGVFDPDLFPLFKADATWKTHPKYGSQAWSIKVSEVPAWCDRMEKLERPWGMDWFFMSPDHLPDHEVHFPSKSLAGQEPGWSERKKGIAKDVGRIEPTLDLGSIYMRSFAEPSLRGRRKHHWAHRVDQVARNTEMQREDSYMNWLAGAPASSSSQAGASGVIAVPGASAGPSGVIAVPESGDEGVTAVPDPTSPVLVGASSVVHGLSEMAQQGRAKADEDLEDFNARRSAALAEYMASRDVGGAAIAKYLEPPPPIAQIDLTRIPATPPYRLPTTPPGGSSSSQWAPPVPWDSLPAKAKTEAQEYRERVRMHMAARGEGLYAIPEDFRAANVAVPMGPPPPKGGYQVPGETPPPLKNPPPPRPARKPPPVPPAALGRPAAYPVTFPQLPKAWTEVTPKGSVKRMLEF